jgi:hydrogenase maturation protease
LQAAVTAPILIFGWGNPARGDDALGPLFVDRIEALNLPDIDCLTDFQLQVEHALDLAGRKLVLFVDASLVAAIPFEVKRLAPARDTSISTHAIKPEVVMQVYVELHDQEPPPCYLLAIRGENLELGSDISPAARQALEAACGWIDGWLLTGRGLSTFSVELS